MEVTKTDAESATLKYTGSHQGVGGGWAQRCTKAGSQMKRNSVAKPLAFIETAIFFFLLQDLDGASRGQREFRAGKTRSMVMS